MRILVQLGHPAHFHLYKNTIKNLEAKNHKVFVLIKKKDILEDLLINANIKYLNILPKGRKDTLLGIIIGIIKRFVSILRFSIANNIDLLTGSSTEVAQVGKFTGKRSIITGEDDADVVPNFIKLELLLLMATSLLLFATMANSMPLQSNTTATTSWLIFIPIILRPTKLWWSSILVPTDPMPLCALQNSMHIMTLVLKA